MADTEPIKLTMYGVAEILKWCIDKNNGRIPGVDTAGFKVMQEHLAKRPKSGDYYTFDQFWKTSVVVDLTPDEIAIIDRCLYDLPNLDNVQLPQIRHVFWPKQDGASQQKEVKS